MLIRIKNLRLRTIVGVYEWEQEGPQEVIVNIEMELKSERAAKTDDLKDTADYKAMKQRITAEVEKGRFKLIERLAGRILEIIMEDSKVLAATVEVDKPHALRFADSVLAVCSARRRK